MLPKVIDQFRDSNRLLAILRLVGVGKRGRMFR
jgi:hypothetical protein